MLEELLLLGSLLISGAGSFSYDGGIQPLAIAWEYANEIEDGAVYFIRSALLDSQVLDVPNSNYSNGQDLIIYHSNGWNNQRFVMNKEGTYGGSTTYTIYPLGAYDYNLSIDGENSNDGRVLQLNKSSSFGSNLNSYKFILTPGTTEDSFRIATGSSGFTKYLTFENYSVSDNTNVVQKAYDSGYAKCFDWYLQKTDSLGVNTKNETNISGTNQIHFNVRVPVSGSYTFETSQYDNALDTVLSIYKDDGTLLKKDDDSGDERFSKLTYYLNEDQDYWLKLSGYNSSQIGRVYLTLKSENTVYINTYHADGDIDTRYDGISPKEDLTNAGYYVRHIVNATKSDMLSTDENGYSRLNNKYYMLSSHGSSSGAALLSSGQYLYGSNLPNMSNSVLSVWAICYGGKEGNIAQYAVKYKNAQNALGFPGLTYANTSKTFTDKLWKEISAGKSVNDAVNSALAHTKSTHWIFEIFGWGADTIISPKLYSKTSVANFSTDISNKILPYISSYSSLPLTNSESLVSFQKKYDTKTFKFDDASIVMKLKNGNLTNEYFIIDNDNNIKIHDTEINFSHANNRNITYPKFELKSNQRITIQNDLNLVIDGFEHTIRRIQYVTANGEFETLDEIYFDVTTNEQFTENQILNAFIA